MALFDSYFDPEQFQASGGLLGRLLSLQPHQGQVQPGADLEQPPSGPQTPALQPMPWPNLPGYGPSSGEQTAPPDLHSQYQSLRPILGDHNAMLATVNPDIGKTLIAQALANRQPDNTANVVSAGFGGRAIRIPSMGPVPLPPIPVPAIPDSWKDAWILLQLYPRIVSGLGGGNDDGNDCYERHSVEQGRCYARKQDYAHWDFLDGCKKRATDRRNLCVRNGGRPDPSELPEWGPADEEVWRNFRR